LVNPAIELADKSLVNPTTKLAKDNEIAIGAV